MFGRPAETLPPGAGLDPAPSLPQLVADAGLSRPELFCGLRSLLEAVGAPVETPVGALQLIVPAMFLWMSVRFGVRFITVTMKLVRGDGDGDLGGDTTMTGRTGA